MTGVEWYEFKTMREAQAEIDRLRALADDLAADLERFVRQQLSGVTPDSLARYREARQP